jgi:hypothetical protein
MPLAIKPNTTAEMPPRNDVSVKLDARVARDAKLVATYRGISVAEYISEVLRPIVAKDLTAEQLGHQKLENQRKRNEK